MQTNFKYTSVTYEYDDKIWEKIPEELLGNIKSLKRATDLLFSRLLLRSLLVEMGEEKVELKNLVFNNFFQLEKFSNYTVSISHTQGLSIAAVAKIDPLLYSLGIDVEWATREVKQESIDFVKNKNDDYTDLTPIEVWCMKEAAFKSLYRFPTAPSNLTVKGIWIKNFTFGFAGNPSPLGNLEIKKEIAPDKRGFLVAIAKGRLAF